jgi:hypothetical protein
MPFLYGIKVVHDESVCCDASWGLGVPCEGDMQGVTQGGLSDSAGPSAPPKFMPRVVLSERRLRGGQAPRIGGASKCACGAPQLSIVPRAAEGCPPPPRRNPTLGTTRSVNLTGRWSPGSAGFSPPSVWAMPNFAALYLSHQWTKCSYSGR